MTENKENEMLKSTLTDQLFKTQNDQNQIMKAFRYRFPSPEDPSQNTISTQHQFRLQKEREKTILTKKSKTDKPNAESFFKIDNKASIVNGKLILFETEQLDTKKNGRQLMKLLKENNISYKEYMLGDKEKFQKQIAQRQKNKEEALIKEYIDKHINMEKTTKIEVANHSGLQNHHK